MIQIPNVYIGSDPELFIQRAGAVIGSEKVVPVEGLYNRQIVLDGVQMELHPYAAASTLNATQNISGIMGVLRERLKQTPEITACWKGVVEVSREELRSLSPESRILGCQPSKNFYGIRHREVDAMRYRKRSAGGHLHFGLEQPIYNHDSIDVRKRLVPYLDTFLGALCVMIDRDVAQVERRKLYGRPGEYRLPAHGLEYRTLSNFWLRCPELAQFVMEMGRMCVGMLFTTLTTTQNLEKQLFGELVELRKVVKLINRNDTQLAKDHWGLIRTFIKENFPETSPIPPTMLDKFERFLAVCIEKGVEEWFPTDPLEAWRKPITGNEWNKFLKGVK